MMTVAHAAKVSDSEYHKTRLMCTSDKSETSQRVVCIPYLDYAVPQPSDTGNINNNDDINNTHTLPQ